MRSSTWLYWSECGGVYIQSDYVLCAVESACIVMCRQRAYMSACVRECMHAWFVCVFAIIIHLYVCL